MPHTSGEQPELATRSASKHMREWGSMTTVTSVA